MTEKHYLRKELRRDLRTRRDGMPPAHARELSERIAGRLKCLVPEPAGLAFGFYWPLGLEPDLRGLAGEWVSQGASASLPETVRNQPLTFRPWHPGCAMVNGIWDIPVPDTDQSAEPQLLLIPCLGHDDAGFRLGYGGGFYDRTLAALRPRPVAIGIGYIAGRIPTIGPEPHDIPMDAIVTEHGVTSFSERACRFPLTATKTAAI